MLNLCRSTNFLLWKAKATRPYIYLIDKVCPPVIASFSLGPITHTHELGPNPSSETIQVERLMPISNSQLILFHLDPVVHTVDSGLGFESPFDYSLNPNDNPSRSLVPFSLFSFVEDFFPALINYLYIDQLLYA